LNIKRFFEFEPLETKDLGITKLNFYRIKVIANSSFHSRFKELLKEKLKERITFEYDLNDIDMSELFSEAK
jgi:hypothetical protein